MFFFSLTVICNFFHVFLVLSVAFWYTTTAAAAFILDSLSLSLSTAVAAAATAFQPLNL